MNLTASLFHQHNITFESVAARRMRLDPTPSLHSIVNGLNCPYNSPTVIDFGFITSISICVNGKDRHAKRRFFLISSGSKEEKSSERILLTKREAPESEILGIRFCRRGFLKIVLQREGNKYAVVLVKTLSTHLRPFGLDFVLHVLLALPL